jgi:hypothetical protein
VYILTDQLSSHEDTTASFRRYQEYLASVAAAFPPNAYALATSPWYHDFSDHRCPHDAWLEEVRVVEKGAGPRQATRTVGITVRLLGGYHDGRIEFTYRDVTAYECGFSRRSPGTPGGHADWRYDEFRLSERGGLLHEIEWWHMRETARWLIEAADVEFHWQPVDITTSAPNER